MSLNGGSDSSAAAERAPVPRVMWKRLSIRELVAMPSAAAWNEIRSRLDDASESGLWDLGTLIQELRGVTSWPIHVSRPPSKTWKRGDPRMALCRVIHETSTYNDYFIALSARVRTSSGKPAVVLTRQHVGGALDPTGQHHITIGKKGQLDSIGFTIIEVGALELPIATEFEVKMDGGALEPEQITHMNGLKNRGVIAICACGIEDAVAQFKTVITERTRAIMAAAETSLSLNPS
jgi:hypothetical protein